MSDDLSGFSLMDLFRSEAETHAATLSEGLLALEGATATSPAMIEPMMRAAHSLKGAARIVGIEPAVKISHAMEDAFVAVQEGKCKLLPRHVDVLLRALDMLNSIAQAPEGAEDAAGVESIVAEIQAILLDTGAVVVAVETVATPEPMVAPEPPASPAPTPEEAPAASPTAEQADRVVRVTAESLTRLMSLAGESLVQSKQLRPFVDSLLALKSQNSALLTTLQAIQDRKNGQAAHDPAIELDLLSRARTQANQCGQAIGDKMEEIEDFARRSEDLSGRLHHEVLASRMRPLADGVRGFPRLVRDIARNLGKQVQLVVAGETTGVDRDILEKLEAPLNHLIRNGLDHAIELPEERLAAGKAATGTIRLEARHRAGMLQIILSDDGRGIDPRRLRAKVVERGLATASMVEQLTEAELLEFLFLPGFSTKEKVTEISGRGVGLDVVQNMVRAVGGFVRVTSQLGQGTRFTLQLPITMSVVRALLVRIAGEPYAFPLNRIDRIVVLPRSAILVLEGRQHFMMDEQPVGLVEACQVLELPPAGFVSDALPVVVASDRSHRFGVVVDEFLGERDLEVRPLDPRLGKVPDINSASVLEDGWPVLIFDVEDLVRSVDNMLGGRRLRKLTEVVERQEARGPRRVLVVDDSITVRELERQLLENAGYVVEVAVDGLDGWNTVRSGDFDLVISDVDMPRMDGIQFVTLIKQDARLRSVPVVIVSYKDREPDRMRGLDAGANAYLTKSSFHDQTFLKTVVDLIGEATA
jgi:two-component system, chemotaxis family, sensor histidine kinase and response regulator WspE